jgi:uncharacterized membrane protein YhaH (DUF805 family)
MVSSTPHRPLGQRLRQLTTRVAAIPLVARSRRLFPSLHGRIPRSTFWYGMLGAWTAFVVLFLVFEALLGRASTLLLYPPFLWSLLALSARRYHDRDKSARRLLWLLIPVAGPVWVGVALGFRRGTQGENRFGAAPTRSSPTIEAAA